MRKLWRIGLGIFVVEIALSFSGCSWRQNMMNSEGHAVFCHATGWGIIGSSVAISSLNNCVAGYEQMGYRKYEDIGVPGIWMDETAKITKVEEGNPAQKVGMKVGGQIVELNGKAVSNRKEAISNGFVKPGELIVYQVRRGEEMKTFTVITIPKAKKQE